MCTYEGKTRHGYRVTYIYILNKNLHFLALGAKPTSHFLAQGFFGK